MRIAVPLAALVLTTWAGTGDSAETGTTEVSFEILRTGSIAGTTTIVSRLTLARDETSFRAIWAELKVSATTFEPVIAPSVDFDHWMVVVFFGSQGDNCDPYGLARVTALPDRITLHINHQLDYPNCTCASTVFEPYIVVKVARSDKPVELEIEPVFHDCRRSSAT